MKFFMTILVLLLTAACVQQPVDNGCHSQNKASDKKNVIKVLQYYNFKEVKYSISGHSAKGDAELVLTKDQFLKFLQETTTDCRHIDWKVLAVSCDEIPVAFDVSSFGFDPPEELLRLEGRGGFLGTRLGSDWFVCTPETFERIKSENRQIIKAALSRGFCLKVSCMHYLGDDIYYWEHIIFSLCLSKEMVKNRPR